MPITDNGSVVRLIPPAVREQAPPAVITPLLTVDPQFLFPGTYDFSVYQGDTYEWWFGLRAQDVTTGLLYPCDITGWRFKAEIRSSPGSPLIAALQEMARDDTEGVIALRLTHDQSRLLTTSGVWDLEAILPEGWVRTCLRGKVTVVSDVTTGEVDYKTSYPR